MEQDINYSPEQLDGFTLETWYWCPLCGVSHSGMPYECPCNVAPSITTIFYWCEKCNDYHVGRYDCPYEDNNYCPHCGQLMRIRR